MKKTSYPASGGRKKKEYTPIDFKQLARKINARLKLEGENLSFLGYKETIHRYFRLHDHDLYELHQVAIECNMWGNYFSEVANYIQSKMLDSQMETDRLNAYFNKKEPDVRIEQAIKESKEKTKDFLLFYKHVLAQKKFFDRCFWHGYKQYGKGIHTLTYKILD